VWNTVQGAPRRQQPAAADSTAPSPAPAPQAAPRSIPQRLTGIFGIALILGIGIALSRNRRAISWRVVGWGVGLQLAFAVFVLRVPFGHQLFNGLGEVVKTILGFSYVGSEFVFGEIGKQHSSLGVIFAFQVLPAIMMAKILEPETETPQTLGGVRVEIPRTDVNVVDAAARGTTDGLHLMLNVIAMLVSFVALVALVNGAFGWVHGYVAWFPENIQT